MKAQFYSIEEFNQYRKRIIPRQFPRVEVSHNRVESCINQINPKGGMTIVRLWINKENWISGVAFCWEKDTYNKRKGKSIAFGRLMRTLYLSGAKMAYLKKYKKLIESKIGIVDKRYFVEAYNGGKIE